MRRDLRTNNVPDLAVYLVFGRRLLQFTSSTDVLLRLRRRGCALAKLMPITVRLVAVAQIDMH
jgi:hypothetical protein